MKFLFSTNSGNTLNDLWLLIFRVTVAVFFMTHGLPKLNRLLDGNGSTFPDPLGVGNNLSLVLAVLGEFVAPLLIIPGLLTRLAAIPAAITMAVAAFIVHAGDPFRDIESALLFLACFLTILILGPGRFSIDHLIYKK